MSSHSTDSLVWTFLPGLHGTEALFQPLCDLLPAGAVTEFVNLPSSGKQDYQTLAEKVNRELPTLSDGSGRLLVAESFSGPLAIRLASMRPGEIRGLVLAASFCDAPLNPGVALLPLRPLFMVRPPRATLRHFLIGEDAGEAEVEALRDIIKPLPSATLSKRVRTILELKEDDNPDLHGIPILILQANNDNLVPWEAQSKLEANFPQAITHWIESPHLILQRCPEECLRYILEFANSIQPGAQDS